MRQDKSCRLAEEKMEKDKVRISETRFRGGIARNSQEKLDNFDPAARFNNRV